MLIFSQHDKRRWKSEEFEVCKSINRAVITEMTFGWAIGKTPDQIESLKMFSAMRKVFSNYIDVILIQQTVKAYCS